MINGRVVEQLPAGGLLHRAGQCLHCLPGVQVADLAEQVGDAGLDGVALQHPVGEQHQPVAGLQLRLAVGKWRRAARRMPGRPAGRAR